METGYATNLPLFRTTASQVDYFKRLGLHIPKLRQLDYVGVYELIDENSNICLDPEATFGLIDSEFNRKPAFNDVREIFNELASVALRT